MASILIVDDEEVFARNAARFLERAGHRVRTAGTLRQALGLLEDELPEVVVLDYRLPDGTGMELVQHIRQRDDAVHLMLVTGHGTIELAVQAMKAGANDLLTKPVALTELRDRISALMQRQREDGRLRYYEAREREAPHEILGESAAMNALRERVDRIAAIDGTGMLPPVLITGETGSGKELVARACHFRSPRRAKPFIEINCAALPAQLLESELMGHERGAFTDARERKIGLIEAADGGTLFLDEVGDMELALQTKLLKVIEDGRLRRLGSVQEQQVQLRIVAATHQDLPARVAEGLFRADLFFRLRVLQLAVPPLRERDGDAVLLARHFCTRLSQRYRREGLRLGARAEAAIHAHPWPGNVRELRNLIEQAVLLCKGPEIESEDLMLPGPQARWAQPAGAGESGPAAAPSPGLSKLEQAERELLVRALEEAQHNVSRAARTLGISRDTLRYRMDKHGLKGAGP